MPQTATPSLQFRKGVITMSLLQVAATVTFVDTNGEPFPLDVEYDVFFQTASGFNLQVNSITKTRNGFTVNLGLAIGATTLRWYAVQQVT